MKFFHVILLAVLSGCSGKELIVVSYIPFGNETFVATTPHNIDENCQICGERRISTSDKHEIIRILDTAEKGSFDSMKVRLKIKIDGRMAFIDNDGGVLFNDNNVTFKLDEKSLRKVAQIVEESRLE